MKKIVTVNQNKLDICTEMLFSFVDQYYPLNRIFHFKERQSTLCRWKPWCH